jgi:hypothetical protein
VCGEGKEKGKVDEKTCIEELELAIMCMMKLGNALLVSRCANYRAHSLAK